MVASRPGPSGERQLPDFAAIPLEHADDCLTRASPARPNNDPRVLRVWDSCAHVRRRSNRPGMAAKASVARHTSSRPPGGEFEFEFDITTILWFGAH